MRVDAFRASAARLGRSEPDDDAAHGALLLVAAFGCERRETLHEVLRRTNRGCSRHAACRRRRASFRAREIAPRRLVELRLERLGAVRLRRERRTADRRAVDREVNARLLELAPQDLVLDVVERHLAAGRPPAHRRPHAVDLPDAVARLERQPRCANRIVIDDRAERERVVGVDPEREPLLARPRAFFRGRCLREPVDGCVERRASLLER
jgi:hypothetical protein